MPHTSKKYRKQKQPSPGINRTTLTIIAVIVIIVAAAGGYYVYSSAQHTTSSTATTSNVGSAGGGNVYAKLVTSQGTFEVELFKNQTPTTVNNFVSLAQNGFFNNLVWHRIARGFVIQTGDPNTVNGQGSPCTWGQGTSGKTIPLEIVPSLHNVAGTLGMASPANGLPSSQFFVNLGDNSASLDGKYTVFGKVISGMSVVNALGSLSISSACGNSSDGPPAQPSSAMLISVTILSSP
ncbi:MAG: peptidylprolyl isomerase [Thaumarchaeota archaeon]|nr:peptidylprolyl isomerase [Nitrososphaerota archaeon]